VPIAVTTAPGCAWTAASNVSWVRIISGASGSGNGTVTFSVESNTDKNDKKREGTLTVAGRTFTVAQSKK
jgi:hypothetical protein